MINPAPGMDVSGGPAVDAIPARSHPRSIAISMTVIKPNARTPMYPVAPGMIRSRPATRRTPTNIQTDKIPRWNIRIKPEENSMNHKHTIVVVSFIVMLIFITGCAASAWTTPPTQCCTGSIRRILTSARYSGRRLADRNMVLVRGGSFWAQIYPPHITESVDTGLHL